MRPQKEVITVLRATATQPVITGPHAPPTLALVDVRKGQGFTQRELAQAVGVSQATVSRWEKGARLPRLWHALAMCRVLGLQESESRPSSPEVPRDHIPGLPQCSGIQTFAEALHIITREPCSPCQASVPLPPTAGPLAYPSAVRLA